MAKKTLLEIVQEILTDMVSDEVNSIDDTVESQTVASIVRSVYESMMANRNWPHTKQLVQTEASKLTCSHVDVATVETYSICPNNVYSLSVRVAQ